MHGSSYDRGRFMKNIGTTSTTDIQLCMWVQRHVCCNKVLLIVVKSYRYCRKIVFRPVSNSFLIYPSLIRFVVPILLSTEREEHSLNSVWSVKRSIDGRSIRNIEVNLHMFHSVFYLYMV